MLYPKLITDDGLQGSGEKHRRSKEGNKQFAVQLLVISWYQYMYIVSLFD
jgi:hypothetical protein